MSERDLRDGLGPHAYGRELEVAVQAVREAAQLCRAVQDALAEEVLQKQDRSPVTVADFGSQAVVCRRVCEAFPGQPIIAEEDTAALRKVENASLLSAIIRYVQRVRPEADEDAVFGWIDQGRAAAYSDRFWTLDPIDGTKGFLRREQYAVALALVVGGEVAVAALACPNLPLNGAVPSGRGAVYVAVRGAGAARIPMEEGGVAESVRVSPNDDPANARFCESVDPSHSSHGGAAAVADRLGIRADPVRMDSQAKYALVARGDAEIYLRLPSRPGYVEKIWDHAAGSLIVTEGGGRVTDMEGRPLEFHHGAELRNNSGVVATNGTLHERVLAAVRELE